MARRNIFLEMAQLKDITPSERQIVDFILNNPQRVVDMTVVELGANSYTSASTVSRVCQKLNCKGFPEFRQRISADLADYQEYIFLNMNKVPLSTSDTLEETLDKIIVNTTRAITDVKFLNSTEKFQKAIDWIMEARKIILYGSGVSNLICHDGMIKGLRMGLDIKSYVFYSEMSIAARLSRSEDLGIIVSYTGLTSEMTKIAKVLSLSKCKTISITSNVSNEIADLCDLNFYVGNTESYYRIGGIESRMSMQCVLDILFTGYYNQSVSAREVSKRTFIEDTFSVKWDKKEEKKK